MDQHGAIVVDGVDVATTMRCCHHGGHFLSIKGSGSRRGWCFKCGSVTCGAPECDRCMPMEKMLELMERNGT